MNEVVVKDNIEIENLIYKVRGKQVMLDSDVARLFGYETKQLNRQVSRNIERFPENYCFRLTTEEYKQILRCQNGTLELKQGQYSKYPPYVFTEYGITMLAGLLKSDLAVKMSLKIVEAFITMRRFLINNKQLFTKVISIENDMKLLNDKVEGYDKNFEQIFNILEDKELVDNGGKVFSDGQIYDAYSLLIDIISQAKEKIIIIDNYIDKTIFDILLYKKTNLNVEIYTNVIKDKLDVEKFNLQYPNVEIHKRKNLHDRYIIIDDKTIYHVGASLKDLGNKCFAISKLSDTLIPTIKKQVQ